MKGLLIKQGKAAQVRKLYGSRDGALALRKPLSDSIEGRLLGKR